MNNEAEENANLQAGYCSKEHFVDIILIVADFFCIVNPTHGNRYEGICNMLATHLSDIFQISLQPYTDFEQFRQAYQDPDSTFLPRFIHKLQDLRTGTDITGLQLPEKQQTFEMICQDIENRLMAEKMAAVLLPLIFKK